MAEETPVLEGHDAGRLLPPMLKRMKAESDQRRRVGVAVYAEDAAFLPQPVGAGAVGGRRGVCHGRPCVLKSRSSSLRSSAL